MKRRDFFKNLAGVAGAVAIAPTLLASLQASAEGRRKGADGGGSEMVEIKDPTAQAVQYVEVSKVKGKDCTTCVLYAKTGMKDGKEIGTCTLFPKKFVYGKAYCNSYAKKG